MLLCDGNLVGVLQNATEGFFSFLFFRNVACGRLFFSSETAAAVPDNPCGD